MNEVVRKILNSSRYATISTVDADGNPWAAPAWYVRDENMNVYWWSPIESHHSKNIEPNPNVYVTIFDSAAPEGYGLGLYIRAVASSIDDDELEQVAFCKKKA